MHPHEQNLLTAVQNADLETVIALADSQNINKTALQDNLRNPILCLALKLVDVSNPDTVDIAEQLIIEGYPLDLANAAGDTPLHIAVQKGHIPLISLLIEQDANLHAVNKRRKTPIHLAVEASIDLEAMYLKEQATRAKAAEIQQRLQTTQPTQPPTQSTDVKKIQTTLPQPAAQPKPTNTTTQTTQPSTPPAVAKALPKQPPFDVQKATPPASPKATPKTQTPAAPASSQAKLTTTISPARPVLAAPISSQTKITPAPTSTAAVTPSGAPVKDLHYYQDKLLRIKYAEILDQVSEIFFRDAVNRIRQQMGAQYLLSEERSGSVLGARQTHQKPSIFISYAQEDLSRHWIAHNLYKHLTENLNCHVYFDDSNMVPGIGFEKFEKAINHNATFVLVIATPLYKAKCDAFKQYGKDKARSGVSDEIEMIEERLKDPKLQDGVIPVIFPGRVPTVTVDPTSGKVWIEIKPNSPIESGYQFLPSSLAGKFGTNWCDGQARKNTNYYQQSFHLLKTLYQIPESRYPDLKRYKKLFLKVQDLVFQLSMEQLTPFKARIEDEKTQRDAQASELLSKDLSLPQAKEAKDKQTEVFVQYAPTEAERKQEALLQAILKGESFQITVSRVKKEVNFSWQDALGDTYMHYTAALGDSQATEELFKTGANPDTQNSEGNTPISEAAAQVQVATIISLLAHGANALQANQDNQRPLDRLLSQSNAADPSKAKKSAAQTAYEKNVEEAALALLNAEAQQQNKSVELVMAEKVQAYANQPTQNAQLKALQQQLGQTHALALSGQHPDLGVLNFGLYQSRADADSALRCLISEEEENRYGKTTERFKREVLVQELKQAIDQNTPQGQTIKRLLIQDMNQRHKAYHGGLWQPEPTFPEGLKQAGTPHYEQHLNAYLDYIAKPAGNEPVYVMIGGFLDAVAELKNKRVCYWQEKAGSLQSTHEYKPKQVKSIVHLLHQGIYFDTMPPQPQAGLLVTPRNEAFSQDYAVKIPLWEEQHWGLEQSYTRWQKNQATLPSNPTQSHQMMERMAGLLWIEMSGLHWKGQIAPAAAEPLPTAKQPAPPTASSSKVSFFQQPPVVQPAQNPLDIIRQKSREVREKSQVTEREVTELLKEVGKGHLNEVKAMLQSNRSLLYAQGAMVDVTDKTYKDITVLQYAYIVGDIDMCEMILEEFKKAGDEAMIRYQLNAEVIQKLGGVYTLKETLEAYDEYIKNYADWNVDQCKKHWCEKIGGCQKDFPAWLRYDMTEEGKDALWCKKAVCGRPRKRNDGAYGMNNKNCWEKGVENRYKLGVDMAWVRLGGDALVRQLGSDYVVWWGRRNLLWDSVVVFFEQGLGELTNEEAAIKEYRATLETRFQLGAEPSRSLSHPSTSSGTPTQGK